MSKSNERIAIELSLHALGNEISHLSKFRSELDALDHIYLWRLHERLAKLCSHLEQQASGQMSTVFGEVVQ